MARTPANKKSDTKAHGRKKPEDTTVSIPLDFESAIRAFLTTPPPRVTKKKPNRSDRQETIRGSAEKEEVGLAPSGRGAQFYRCRVEAVPVSEFSIRCGAPGVTPPLTTAGAPITAVAVIA